VAARPGAAADWDRYPAGTKAFLAGSTAGQAGTYVRSRPDVENAYVIADGAHGSNGATCRMFEVPTTGWYAVVGVFTAPVGVDVTPGAEGTGFVVQRYDPDLGEALYDCPDPDFSS
jgi:hypothetical protein